VVSEDADMGGPLGQGGGSGATGFYQ
jgi:hypothetical protein